MADYPTTSFNPTTKSSGNTIEAAHMNDVQAEIRAIELALLSTGLAHVLTANAGIAFPAAQVASSGANVLDDYEEDVWTPVIGGSGGTSGQAYVAQVGRYIKVGKLVVAEFYAELSTEGTITTNVQIQGLPFTAENVGGLERPAALLYANLATNWVNVIARVVSNTTTASVTGAAAAATTNATPLTAADIGNTTSLYGVLTYRAAA